LEEELKRIRTYLNDRGYRRNTIKIYSGKLAALFYYYPGVKPIEITEKQILDFANMLVDRRKSSFSTVSHLKSACKFYFIDLLGKDYKINKIRLPKRKFKTPNYLTQHEAIQLIDSFENPKHKAIVAMLYSCRLEIEELLNIKVGDFVKGKNQLIVRSPFGEEKRRAYLSEEMREMLKQYWQVTEPKPKSYFFEGQKGGQYSASSIRNLFKKQINELGFNSELTPMNLRRSYIYHMVKLGAPIVTLLDELDIRSWDTQRRYTDFIRGKFDFNFTPLDRIVIEGTFDQSDIDKIESLVMSIEDYNTRDYLTESISCLRNGAKRAAVILIWNACMHRIRTNLFDNSDLKQLNTELRKIFTKAKEIKTYKDFEYIKDETTLILSANMKQIDKFQKDILIDNCLLLRNKCGHPSDYSPEEFRVKAFIEDVINILFK